MLVVVVVDVAAVEAEAAAAAVDAVTAVIPISGGSPLVVARGAGLIFGAVLVVGFREYFDSTFSLASCNPI